MCIVLLVVMQKLSVVLVLALTVVQTEATAGPTYLEKIPLGKTCCLFVSIVSKKIICHILMVIRS